MVVHFREFAFSQMQSSLVPTNGPVLACYFDYVIDAYVENSGINQTIWVLQRAMTMAVEHV